MRFRVHSQVVLPGRRVLRKGDHEIDEKADPGFAGYVRHCARSGVIEILDEEPAAPAAPKTDPGFAEPDPIPPGFMEMTKAELLALAEDVGADAGEKMTKEQIRKAIIEHVGQD